MGQVNTYSSTSCGFAAIQTDGRPMMENYGLTKEAADDYAGRPWWNTNDSTVPIGSWKTRALRKTCMQPGGLKLDALVDAADGSAGSIEVGGSVAPEPNGPAGCHDRLHDTPARSGVVSPGADLSRLGASLLDLAAGAQDELTSRFARRTDLGPDG
ncbi:unnamed protein product [Phytophthora fragariaefolia]|uniref:Unnamed protein product n=1 Tax=Phytophthora fragariaefolia TaxID=1490495 RepID=A0A9W6U3S4_9STRA|nr:unnamed protein product [Phytophthora fragariaefolia]